MDIQIGQSYRFAYPAEFVTLPEYSAHRGQTVTVIRPLTQEEAAGPEQGEPQMYLVRAADGWEGHAWGEEELEPVES